MESLTNAEKAAERHDAVDHASTYLFDRKGIDMAEARPGEPIAKSGMHVLTQVEQEAIRSAVMSEPLVAVGSRRIDRLDLHRAIPVGCRRHRAAVGAKADQPRTFAILLAAQLADVK